MQSAPLNISDLDTFVDPDEFAVFFEFRGSEYHGIFEDSFSAFGESDIQFESSVPQLFAKTVDVSGAMHGDEIIIGMDTFTIVEIRPDLDGFTLLLLAR